MSRTRFSAPEESNTYRLGDDRHRSIESNQGAESTAITELRFDSPGSIRGVVVADEFNRGSPKTQSSFLEAMAEGNVSIEGKTLTLPDPFLVVTTQTPSDQAGTFELPRVEHDRFMMKVSLSDSDREESLEILDRFDARPHIDASNAEQVVARRDIGRSRGGRSGPRRRADSGVHPGFRRRSGRTPRYGGGTDSPGDGDLSARGESAGRDSRPRRRSSRWSRTGGRPTLICDCYIPTTDECSLVLLREPYGMI